MIDSYNENNKMNSSNIFFKPYVGTFYNEGINGKKVLVLGASFYCGMSQCIYYKDCTNENIKDSSPYDDICPYYDVALHNAPSTENGTAYSKFANSIAKALDINQDRFWDFVSFTNYIQFFLPHWQTFMEDCSDRDAKALIEIIRSLQPEIIFIWGCVINQHIKDSFSQDIKIVENTDGYIWNWNVDDKVITVINTYHPTYHRFNDNGRLSQYVRQVFLK